MAGGAGDLSVGDTDHGLTVEDKHLIGVARVLDHVRRVAADVGHRLIAEGECSLDGKSIGRIAIHACADLAGTVDAWRVPRTEHGELPHHHGVCLRIELAAIFVDGHHPLTRARVRTVIGIGAAAIGDGAGDDATVGGDGSVRIGAAGGDGGDGG